MEPRSESFSNEEASPALVSPSAGFTSDSSTGSRLSATRRRASKPRSRTSSSGSTGSSGSFRTGPPIPTPEELKEREQAFVLDNVALSFRANAEPHRTAPSLNIGIPQYNGQRDVHTKNYFQSRGVAQTLERSYQAKFDDKSRKHVKAYARMGWLPHGWNWSPQMRLNWSQFELEEGGTSMIGEVFDRLVSGSHSTDELRLRNEHGAGYDYAESVCGHNLPISKPFNGYNGPNGYRRNTWALRKAPSSFGKPDFNCFHDAVPRSNRCPMPDHLGKRREKCTYLPPINTDPRKITDC